MPPPACCDHWSNNDIFRLLCSETDTYSTFRRALFRIRPIVMIYIQPSYPSFLPLCPSLPVLSFVSLLLLSFSLSLARGPVERCLISCHRGKADDFWRIFSLRWSISQWHRHRCVLPQTSNQHQTCDVSKDSPYLFTVSYCDFQF